MRNYGVIQSDFWHEPVTHSLSDDGKLLAVYLLTSPHTTSLGCFRLPMAYIAADLGWTQNRVLRGFQSDLETHFLSREGDWIFIHDFLKTNSIENLNQWKSNKKLFKKVPRDLSFSCQLINTLLKYCEFIPEEERKGFERVTQTLSKGLPKPFRNQEQEQEQEQDQEQEQEQDQEQEQEPEQEQKQELLCTNVHNVVGEKPTTSIFSNFSKCPHEKILALYHELLPECPKVLVWNEYRRKLLRARWKEYPDLGLWKQYFNRVRQSQFLMGNATGSRDRPPFIATLEWLIRPNNFVKVLEGKYAEKS